MLIHGAVISPLHMIIIADKEYVVKPYKRNSAIKSAYTLAFSAALSFA